MLSENLANVLAFIKSSPHGKAYRSELLRRVDSESTLSLLVRRGLLKSAFLDAEPFYRLTPEGEQALIDWRSAAEETRRQRAEQERREAVEERQHEEDRAHAAKENRKNRHHDYFVTAFEVLFAYAVGVVTEAEFDIAALVVDLFKKLLALFH